AQVTDTGVDVQPAVRGDAHQAVEAAAAGGVIGLADAYADHLAAVAFAVATELFCPAELGGALVQRLDQMGAGDGTLLVAEARIAAWGVDAADGDGVEAEVTGGLVQQRFYGDGELVLAGAALRSLGGRVGEHWQAAEAHGLRRVDQRQGLAGGQPVGETGVAAVVLDDVEIGGEQATVGAETEPGAALEAVAGPAYGALLFAG